MDLNGKVCLITGGTKGIGAACAIELARRGAHISVNGRSADPEATNIKAQVEAAGRKCFLHIADVSRPEAAVECAEATAAEFGALDVLVHSAGGPFPGSLLDVDSQTWYQAFEIHVHAIFHLCRAAVPWMKQRNEGAIVLISSAAGIRGCAGAIAYGVVKGALPQFARALARELANDNIRVNCVSPGIIRTRFQEVLTPEQVRNNITNRIPLHREGRPEDVAEAVTALVSNGFITGENLAIDGGMSMRIA